MRRALRVPGVGLLLAGQTLSMFGDRALQLDLCEDFLCHTELDLLDLVEADLDRSLAAED